MLKRIISLGLCLVMLAVLFAGCGKKDTTTTDTTNTEDLPSTINLVGITDAATTDASVKLVEAELNKLTKTRYKTKVNLTLVTADEYIAEVEKRVAEADQAAIRIEAISKFNALAQKEANNAQKLLNESSGKNNNKWTSQVTTVIASTMATGEIYSAEMTTVYEDGKIETVYPDAESPIDILMIDNKETYDYLNEKGYLLSIEKKLDEKFTKFRQYIYPTFFSQLKAITGDINAIPNNNLLAEYTYLVVDKAIAESGSFNIDNVDNYDDLSSFLAYVKANHTDVVPMNRKPEALGIFKYMDGDVAIGAYFDPIYGYSTEENTDFEVQNLLDIPEYRNYVATMEDYTNKGYIGDGTADNFAVDVIKGDAYLADEYTAKGYEVKIIQNPFVTADAIFDGMMAVSSYTSSEDRALEIIEMFNTDPEAKNLFQYGICDDGDNTKYANYKLVEVEDGQFKLQRLNSAEYTYVMYNNMTGNVYMGYPDSEDGQPFDAWTYYKKTNLDSNISPFLLLYVEESALDDILGAVVKRAALTEALAAIGIDYEDYMEDVVKNDSTAVKLMKDLRNANLTLLVSKLADEGAKYEPFDFITTANASEAVNEFVKFALSAEGLAILKAAGYTENEDDLEWADPYEKVDSLSGTITMYSNTGSSTRTYFENAYNGLVNAFKEIYPNVEITVPALEDNDYKANMSNVNSPDKLGFTHANAPNLTATTVAYSYLKIVADTSASAAYSQSWYENQIVEAVRVEKFAEIISASDLENEILNKVAVLGGATNFADEKTGEVQPNSQRLTLAAARTSASKYYNNIKYLRVMADEILFADASEADRAKYDAMTEVDFEKAVFNYVKANYETENNLTDEEYQTRVQNFMVSVLEYVSEEDSSVKYLVSWDEFIAAEEGSTDYLNAAAAIVEQYKAKIKAFDIIYNNDALLAQMSLDQLMDVVYKIMFKEYRDANGLTENEFDATIYNKFLNTVGADYADFKNYSKTSDEYKNYVNKLRKKYKAVLIDTFSATAYKNGEKGISNEKVVSALYDHFLEEELGIYKQMAEMSNMSVADFRASEKHYTNYNKYINTLKTKYVYTIRAAGVSDNTKNSWSLIEAKTNIYNILAETGFYTNELARYIGLDLNEYMLAKSDAVTYQNYMKAIANKLDDAKVTAMGYNKTDLINGNGSDLEAVAEAIVAEEYFGDKKGITEVLKELTGGYVKDYATSAELEASAQALAESERYTFFMAVVNELQTMWEDMKETN